MAIHITLQPRRGRCKAQTFVLQQAVLQLNFAQKWSSPETK
jgi:hypothetical protein